MGEGGRMQDCRRSTRDEAILNLLQTPGRKFRLPAR
jgi:hypothetical protein